MVVGVWREESQPLSDWALLCSSLAQPADLGHKVSSSLVLGPQKNFWYITWSHFHLDPEHHRSQCHDISQGGMRRLGRLGAVCTGVGEVSKNTCLAGLREPNYLATVYQNVGALSVYSLD